MLAANHQLLQKEFSQAPKEISCQYPESDIAAFHEVVTVMEEDPAVVIDCIVDQLTVFSPVLNNYPGLQAKLLAWLLWVSPLSLQHFVEVLLYELNRYGPRAEIVQAYQQGQ